jgi:hypothetical protein
MEMAAILDELGKPVKHQFFSEVPKHQALCLGLEPCKTALFGQPLPKLQSTNNSIVLFQRAGSFSMAFSI